MNTVSSASKPRLQWLDILKGIAMFFVVPGHTAIYPPLEKYIYSFHMPLFFMISGMTWRKDKYPAFQDLLKDKAKRLLLPYVWLNLLVFPIYLLNKYVLGLN